MHRIARKLVPVKQHFPSILRDSNFVHLQPRIEKRLTHIILFSHLVWKRERESQREVRLRFEQGCSIRVHFSYVANLDYSSAEKLDWKNRRVIVLAEVGKRGKERYRERKNDRGWKIRKRTSTCAARYGRRTRTAARARKKEGKKHSTEKRRIDSAQCFALAYMYECVTLTQSLEL